MNKKVKVTKSINKKSSSPKSQKETIPQRRETDKLQPKPLPPYNSKLIITIVSSLFIIIGTIIAIYFIRGYRITFKGVGEKTGAISVNSSPPFSNIYLDNESIGRSPQTEALVSQGIHNIRIEKKGYITWDKNVEIVEGKSTPLSIPLFYKSPKAETIFKGENDIINIFNDSEKQNIFIVTSKEISTKNDITIADKKKTNLITIQKYDTQAQFWQNSNNPTLLFEQELLADNLPIISSSFDGKYLLLEFTSKKPSTTPEIEESQIQYMNGAYILNTNSTSTELTEIPHNLQSVATNYQWSADNTLLVTTKDVLISLDIPSFRQEVLLTGNLSTIVYSIDKQGNLYYLTLTESQTTDNEDKIEPAYYSILQSSTNGNDTEVVEKIYFNKTDKYLRSDIDETLQIPFRNSPESYKFAGEIQDFIVNTKAKSIIIKTEFALYHYNIKTMKYTIISTGNSKFISFSPDYTKLIYKNDIGLGIFTFDKEEADYISALGSKILLAKNEDNNIQNIFWHKSSEILIYQDQIGTNIIDLDGAYNHLLTPHIGFSMTDVDAEILYTLEKSKENNAFSLNMFILR